MTNARPADWMMQRVLRSTAILWPPLTWSRLASIRGLSRFHLSHLLHPPRPTHRLYLPLRQSPEVSLGTTQTSRSFNFFRKPLPTPRHQRKRMYATPAARPPLLKNEDRARRSRPSSSVTRRIARGTSAARSPVRLPLLRWRTSRDPSARPPLLSPPTFTLNPSITASTN